MRSHFNTEKSKCPVVSSKKRLLMATVIRANWAPGDRGPQPGDRVHEQVLGEELRRDYNNHTLRRSRLQICVILSVDDWRDFWAASGTRRPDHQMPLPANLTETEAQVRLRKSPNDQIRDQQQWRWRGLSAASWKPDPPSKVVSKEKKAKKIHLLSLNLACHPSKLFHHFLDFVSIDLRSSDPKSPKG